MNSLNLPDIPNARGKARDLMTLKDRHNALLAGWRQEDREREQTREQHAQISTELDAAQAQAMAGLNRAKDIKRLSAEREELAAVLADPPNPHIRQQAERALRGQIIDLIANNWPDIEAALRPAAEAAQARVTAALTELSEATDDWWQTANDVTAVVSLVPGRNGQEIPTLADSAIRTDVEKLRNVGVPVPLPAPRAVVGIVMAPAEGDYLHGAAA